MLLHCYSYYIFYVSNCYFKMGKGPKINSANFLGTSLKILKIRFQTLITQQSTSKIKITMVMCHNYLVLVFPTNESQISLLF